VLYKKPKNDNKYAWTNHVVGKMAYYKISESLVKRVVRFPNRIEKGIAPETTVCMQSAGSKKHPSEIWVMLQELDSGGQRLYSENQKPKTKNYKLETNRKKIISAWRYPGISKVGEPIPIPEDILDELTAL